MTSTLEIAILFRQYRINQIKDTIRYIDQLLDLDLTDYSKNQLKQQRFVLQGEKYKYENEIKNRKVSILLSYDDPTTDACYGPSPKRADQQNMTTPDPVLHSIT